MVPAQYDQHGTLGIPSVRVIRDPLIPASCIQCLSIAHLTGVRCCIINYSGPKSSSRVASLDLASVRNR